MLKWIARLRRSDSPPKGFLGRLRRDVRGNTLAIVGAALVPLTAMIGSGVDMSRAYMARTRLQSACDAAALAGRRVMVNDTLTSSETDPVRVEARRFFDFNFNQGAYQTAAFTPQVTRPAAGTIRVTASTTIPTSIMRMFGFTTLPLDVTCDASLNFVNTDIMLVLDVTGSMLCTPQESGSCGRQTEISTSRIVALRAAVMALYDELRPTQTQLEANGLRLRYGIVPYSTSVNVGRLITGEVPVPAGGGLAGNPSYIRDSAPYQSRIANYTTPGTPVANTPTAASGWEENASSVSSSTCSTWVTAGSVNGGGPPPTATTVTSYRGSESNASYVQSTNWGWSGAPDTSGTNRSCRRWRTVTTTTYTVPYTFTNWTYNEVTLDTSTFRTAGGTITLATNGTGTVPTSGSYNPQQLASTGSGMATTTVSWNGCIEERDTTSVITGSDTNPIPNNAFDLDINRIPNNDNTRWRPMLPQAIYTRATGSTAGPNAWNPSASSVNSTSTTNWMTASGMPASYYACPSEARRLQAWTQAAMQSYVNNLIAVGGTYHDIGMIWGARMISSSGIFADSPSTFAGMPVARHVIFMTDGQQTAYCNVYTAYGVARNDMRTRNANDCTSDSYVNDVPTSTATADLLARHRRRFQLICEATKNLGASVWVIAFATGLSPELTSCASNPNQASTSTNQADLIARFREIGSNIGALRLTQ